MRGFAGVLLLLGCGASAPVGTRTPTQDDVAHVPPPLVDASGDSMGISGIQSSMAVADAHEAMRPRMEALFDCFAPRSANFEPLGGRIRLLIHLEGSGRVLAAKPEGSTVGDREVERCVSGVVMDTPFPRTSGGGEVELRWSFVVEPSRPEAEPVLWDAGRVDRVVRRRSPHARAACDTEVPVQVTAYVRHGRVVSAGAASTIADEASLDCIANHVRRWRMPSVGRMAKVTFDLS